MANVMQCDPELCPDNKAYSKAAEASKDASFRSLPTVKEVKKADMYKNSSRYEVLPIYQF
jgi:hypothetical protein